MSKTLQIKNSEKINASLVFFIITACQIGVGIHGFQRLIIKEAKQDAWVSVILSFVCSHIVVFVMIKTLELYQTKDLYEIQRDVFGKVLGNLLNWIYILYFIFSFFIVIRNYTEVINTWVFPDLSQGFIVFTLLLIVIYAFTGGFRLLVGISFFSFFFILWVPFALIYPFEYTHYNHLYPILANDLAAIIKGAYQMTFTIVGFEILYFVYPFIKDHKKVQKFAHLGLLFTLFLYLLLILVAILFFSKEQLERTIWATLTLFSIVKLPFIERIEMLVICIWMIIILPNLCLFLWAAYRGFSRISKMKPRVFLSIFCMIILIANFFIQSRYQINRINNYFAHVAFYIVFIYPFLLYIWARVKIAITNRVKKQ